MKNNNISNMKLNFINNNYPNSKVNFTNGNGDKDNDKITFDLNSIQTNDAVNISHNDSINNSMLERDLDKKTRHYLRYPNKNTRMKSNPYLR